MSSLQIIDENNKEEKEVIECPICYDEIDQLKNCVTTECGHQFHCKCLMQNSATNGFSCPMCRSIMAEELADSDSEGEYDEEGEIEDFDDNALTSFRMFHQQLAGEEVEEEEEEDQDDQDQELVLEEELIVKPTAAIIAAKLIEQGYTMEYMVACMLIDHEEYETDAERYNSCADRMFGKFRQIISNYPREMQEQQAAVQQAAVQQAAAAAAVIGEGEGERERHQSTRLRIRAEVEINIGRQQNRYRILEDEDEDDV
jgi:hypothetical protein